MNERLFIDWVAITLAQVLRWMDEILPPPKKPRNDDSPVNAMKQWFFMRWCETDFATIHSMLVWREGKEQSRTPDLSQAKPAPSQ